MFRILRMCVLAILVPVLPAFGQETAAGAGAQGAAPEPVTNGQKFGAWTVNCVAVAVGKTNCVLTQRILRSSDGAFVADLVAAEEAGGGTVVIARVPLGVFLPAGFAMREAENEDQEDVLQFDWQLCNAEVCEALLRLDAEQANAFSGDENSMIAAFRPSAQSEIFAFQFSMRGMAQGLTAIRSD